MGHMTVFALFFATFMYSRGKNHAVFARDHAELHVSLPVPSISFSCYLVRCSW
jgi:hypothetical protein